MHTATRMCGIHFAWTFLFPGWKIHLLQVFKLLLQSPCMSWCGFPQTQLRHTVCMCVSCLFMIAVAPLWGALFAFSHSIQIVFAHQLAGFCGWVWVPCSSLKRSWLLWCFVKQDIELHHSVNVCYASNFLAVANIPLFSQKWRNQQYYVFVTSQCWYTVLYCISGISCQVMCPYRKILEWCGILMELGTSWEVTSCSYSQKFPLHLCNP
jgi:hypothetical protein